jgi:hypothetical protein
MPYKRAILAVVPHAESRNTPLPAHNAKPFGCPLAVDVQNTKIMLLGWFDDLLGYSYYRCLSGVIHRPTGYKNFIRWR